MVFRFTAAPAVRRRIAAGARSFPSTSADRARRTPAALRRPRQFAIGKRRCDGHARNAIRIVPSAVGLSGVGEGPPGIERTIPALPELFAIGTLRALKRTYEAIAGLGRSDLNPGGSNPRERAIPNCEEQPRVSAFRSTTGIHNDGAPGVEPFGAPLRTRRKM